MTDAELLAWLYHHAKTGVVNWRDGAVIREAADRLSALLDHSRELEDKLEAAEERIAIMEVEQ
jgi:hypothetical protein